MASTPQSISSCYRTNYCIKLSSFWVVVRQNPCPIISSQRHRFLAYLARILHPSNMFSVLCKIYSIAPAHHISNFIDSTKPPMCFITPKISDGKPKILIVKILVSLRPASLNNPIHSLDFKGMSNEPIFFLHCRQAHRLAHKSK